MQMADEEMQFNVGDDESPATVTLTPTEGNKVDAVVEEGELDQYSDRVKRRIDKLTARLRETERREQAALEYAKGAQQKAQELEHRYQRTDYERLNEASTRLDSQALALKQIIRKAREEGDVDTETEAQQRLTSIMFEKQQVTSVAAQREAYLKQPPQQQQVVQQARPVAKRQPDPKAEDWAERNEWFGQDTVMTHAAWGVHKELIQKEGFDPASDEYYDELDKRMRDLFPQRLDRASTVSRGNRPVQTVAPAARSMGSNHARRTVRLTPSQVAIAKKLGVPLEEYAKYVKE
jgi:hypothetical protein